MRSIHLQSQFSDALCRKVNTIQHKFLYEIFLKTININKDKTSCIRV